MCVMFRVPKQSTEGKGRPVSLSVVRWIFFYKQRKFYQLFIDVKPSKVGVKAMPKLVAKPSSPLAAAAPPPIGVLDREAVAALLDDGSCTDYALVVHNRGVEEIRDAGVWSALPTAKQTSAPLLRSLDLSFNLLRVRSLFRCEHSQGKFPRC